ncbi:MAG: hypothetical protein JKY25_03225 [Robiginitomaculum sp.]|nr:hypothetical protein [Robiginitomaculum sp.]
MNDYVLDLADGFETGDEAQWRALSEKALRGADFGETLVRRSEDGIKRGPLFTKAPGFTDTPETTCLRKVNVPHLAGRAWHIAPVIDHPDIDHANRDILADLEGGASALRLKIDPSGKAGIAVRTRVDMQRLLSGVYVGLVPIHLSPSFNNFEAAAVLAGLYKGHGDLNNIHLGLGYTPEPDSMDKSVSLATWVRAHAPHWKAFSVNAARTHEAGATTAQELAYMLASAVANINALLDGGFEIDEILPLMDVHLAVAGDGHWDICKLRAARMLWTRMADSYGAAETTCTIHATTSRRMLSKLDPWSNMLRLGGASFAGICGGADYITTLPFTEPLGLATPFARRIARNTQILFMEESRLGQVTDPAAGSYTHETLSRKIADAAWGLFQDIERRGGWTKANHWFAKQMSVAAKRRDERIKSGEIKLVGINQFAKPDVREAKVLPRPKIKPKSSPITDTGAIDTDDFVAAINQAQDGRILPENIPEGLFKSVRLSEPFEAGDAQ